MQKSTTFLITFFLLFAFSSNSQGVKPRTTIDHIAIYVVDLEVSTKFYQDIVGLEKIPEPFNDGKHTWFDVGSNAQLHLIEGAAGGTNPDKNSHLSFRVPSVSNFIEILDKNGVGYEDWEGEKQAVTNRVDGVQQVYITDPDGYWLEINDAK